MAMLKEDREAEDRRQRCALCGPMKVQKDEPLSPEELERIGRNTFEYHKKMGWIPADAVYHRDQR